MMRFIPLILLLSGCTSYIASMQDEKKSDILFDEMRIEISDLKHALHANQVEIGILEEKVKKQDSLIAQNKSDIPVLQMNQLERKIAALQKAQEQICDDIKQLHSHAKDTAHSLYALSHEIEVQNKKFEEISKLKMTLSSLSKTMDYKSNVHRVKAGETLERIARNYNTTVAELKKLNQLESDRIVIDQELKLP